MDKSDQRLQGRKRIQLLFYQVVLKDKGPGSTISQTETHTGHLHVQVAETRLHLQRAGKRESSFLYNLILP